MQPMLTYVNAFCTHLFTSLTLDEIESAIVSGQSSPRLVEILNFDYTDPEDFDGRSLVTGLLGVRDSGLGMSAVAGFNRALI